MTENSWAHDESLAIPDLGQQVSQPQALSVPPAADPNTADSSQSGKLTSDMAKAEAGEVARQAAGAAHHVSDTVKEEAVNVVAEVKTNARDLLGQTISDLTEQAATQQQKVAEGLHSVSTELHAMVSASEHSGMATDLVRQAAERSAAVAVWLEERDPGSVLAEVKSFARAKPGTFLLLAAGAGIVVGRLSRSLSAGAPEPTGPAAHPRTQDTVAPLTPAADTAVTAPPAPADPPDWEASSKEFPVTYPSPPMGETGTYPVEKSGTDAQTGPGRPELWRAEPVVVEPLPEFDPLHDDPFDGGRR
ncbi:hypothetical protein [Arthrobacter sp. lap29]|uniref:hypothetical protein n=1 Tax=Arthrobacter sp. lap29 TaxID=3056122 RepID=UPI0028F6CBFA|nr:hypothetical protein [Arthrobacter sp. lap29]